MNPLDAQNDMQKRQRRLHMPVVPCCLTAASVAQLVNMQDNGGTNMDSESNPRAAAAAAVHNNWLVDPHPDELLAVDGHGVVATVVVDARAAAAAAENVILAWHHGPHHHHSLNGIGGNSNGRCRTVGVTSSQLAQLVLLATSHARDMLAALSPQPTATSTTTVADT
jgi:hypothetical protein